MFLDYWIDTITYYEQPNIKHLNEIMVYMYTDDGVFSFGSTKNLNDLFDGSFEESTKISPQFTVLNQDTNKDGIADQIELKFTVNTDGSKIRNIAII